MFERILVPLDGSKLAEELLPFVTEIAKRFSSQVILLRAVTPFVQLLQATTASLAEMTPPTASLGIDAARQQLETEVKTAEDYLATVSRRMQNEGVETRVHVAEGAPGAAILDYAREVAADLIAMSTHGRSGLGRLVFGSVANEVLRNSHLPLLLVRPGD